MRFVSGVQRIPANSATRLSICSSATKRFKEEGQMKKILTKSLDTFRNGLHWAWGHKLRVAVLGLVFALVAPRPVTSQFLDPCCAILSVGLSTIASTLSGIIGGGLNNILSVDQTIQNFEQTVVWPQQLI